MQLLKYFWLQAERVCEALVAEDLSGIDTKAHNNVSSVIIQSIRDWFKTSSRRNSIPGHLSIIKDFAGFQTELPSALANLNLETSTLTFNDLCLVIEEFIKPLIAS